MSRKPDLWMPLYIADYLADTTHLSAEQHGAYILMLMASWKRGGSLPDDGPQLASIARLDAAKWRKHEPILRAFFDAEGGLLIQKRLAEEYADAVKVHDAQKSNGAKGGRPKKQTQQKPMGFDSLNPRANPKPNPDETPSPSPIQKPDQKPEQERSPKGSRLPPDWLPTAADIAFAKAERPDISWQTEADKFRDYWHAVPGGKGLKTNWPATWRNWIRRADGKPRAGPGNLAPSRQMSAVANLLGVHTDDLASRPRAVVRQSDSPLSGELVPAEPRRLPGGGCAGQGGDALGTPSLGETSFGMD